MTLDPIQEIMNTLGAGGESGSGEPSPDSNERWCMYSRDALILQRLLARDKRRCERLHMRAGLYYSPFDSIRDDGEPSWVGPFRLTDLSGDGLCFHSKKRLRKGTRVLLRIVLPRTEEPLTVSGTIAWSHMKSEVPSCFAIGVRFSKMRHAERKTFVTYICDHILTKYLNRTGKVNIQWTKRPRKPSGDRKTKR